MPRHEVDVSPVGSPPMPAVPESNAHLAPVRAEIQATGTEPAVRNLLPDSWAPYALAGAVLLGTVGQELMNPAPWTQARVGATLIGLSGTALAWLVKAPQVKSKQ